MRRYTRKGRGGDLPPNTDAQTLENQKKKLNPIPAGTGDPKRDVFGKKVGGPQGGRTRRRRRRSRRSKTY